MRGPLSQYHVCSDFFSPRQCSLSESSPFCIYCWLAAPLLNFRQITLPEYIYIIWVSNVDFNDSCNWYHTINKSTKWLLAPQQSMQGTFRLPQQRLCVTQQYHNHKVHRLQSPTAEKVATSNVTQSHNNCTAQAMLMHKFFFPKYVLLLFLYPQNTR